MGQSRYVTLTLADEGTLKKYSFRLRRWLLFAAVLVSAGAIVLSLLLLISMSSVISRALETDALRQENAQLLSLQKNYADLEVNMRQMQEFVGRLATIAGVDYEYALDSFGISNVPGASTIMRPQENIDFPVGLPVEGFISRAFSDEHGNYHPGIDLACPLGTPVLATASGVVESAVFDQEYGYVVTIRHSDTVKTLYGHNREILVDPGQQIDVGSRIALSGNTGRSTAPHVHYEIRIHDKPINPVEGPEHD